MIFQRAPLSALAQAAEVIGSVFGNRQLRRVELAFAGFNTAEWAVWIAMLVYAYGRGGTIEAGLVVAAQLVPAALFAPLGSVLGDRFRPGRVLFWGYVAQAAGMALTGAVLLAGGPALLAYGTAACAATGVTVIRPTMTALTPALARRPEELTAVNVISGWIRGLSTFVAPALTGVLLAISGSGTVFVVMAIVVAVSALLVWTEPGPPPAGEEEVREAVSSAIGAAFRVLRRERSARVLVMVLCANFVALGALDVLYPELAIATLDRGASWAGYLNAAFGAGATVAIVFTAGLVGRPRLAPTLALGLVTYVAAFGLLALHQAAASALVLLALAGIGLTVVDVASRTLLQRIAPADTLARVFGIVEGVAMAALVVGALAVSALVAVGGVQLALAGIGLLIPLAILLTGRSLFEIDRDATVPVVQIGLLRSLPLFAPLPPTELEAVARSLERVEAPAGTRVIRQGDVGDRFYVIADGAVGIVADGVHLQTLARGDGFGEIALVTSEPRTATCTTETAATLYTLRRDDFLTVVTGNPRVAAEVRRLVSARSRAGSEVS